MKRIKWIAICLALVLLAGCAPMITVQNDTSFPVRAIVRSGKTTDVLSPSPGYSSTAEVTEGPYRVTVVPDAEWVEYAKTTRAYLNDQLAHADQLTGPQLLEVIRRLKEIATAMQQFEQAGVGASCSGKITEEGGGLVTVTLGANGALVVVCQ